MVEFPPNMHALRNFPYSLILVFTALSAVQISYICGGIGIIDLCIWLLVPAFFLFLFDLFKAYSMESKDYGVGLALILAALAFALFFKSRFEIGTMDDNYHNAKIVALSLDNGFASKWQYVMPKEDHRFFLVECIEGVWGLFWRYTHWDFWIVVIQALPLLVLWQRLVDFFRNQNCTRIAGFFATVILISMETLWSQMGSTYIDSIAGICGAIALLMSYEVLTQTEIYPSYLAGLGFISGLCLVTKASVMPIGLLGVTLAIVYAWRTCDWSSKIIVIVSMLPSFLYLLYNQIQVWMKKGDPFYPLSIHHNGKHDFDSAYHYYYEASPIFTWIKDHAFNFKPLHIMASWIQDWWPDADLTPDPWVRGNGLVFGYFVFPLILFWIISQRSKWMDLKNWRKPSLILLGLIVIEYLTFDGSLGARFMVAYNILILAWCLSWGWRRIEHDLPVFNYARTGIVCLMIGLAAISFFDGIRSKRMENKIFSPLEAQLKVFPQYVETDTLRKMILQQIYSR